MLIVVNGVYPIRPHSIPNSFGTKFSKFLIQDDIRVFNTSNTLVVVRALSVFKSAAEIFIYFPYLFY
jgi:hypothetical protein